MNVYLCIKFLYFILGKCLVVGFGHTGHAVYNIPGLCLKVVEVGNISLLPLYKVKKRNQDHILPYYHNILTNYYIYNLYFNL